MSIKLMSQVWEMADVSGSELLLLLALADYANDKDICWPSLPTLAKRARISERQTQRVIQQLEADGASVDDVVRVMAETSTPGFVKVVRSAARWLEGMKGGG